MESLKRNLTTYIVSMYLSTNYLSIAKEKRKRVTVQWRTWQPPPSSNGHSDQHQCSDKQLSHATNKVQRELRIDSVTLLAKGRNKYNHEQAADRLSLRTAYRMIPFTAKVLRSLKSRKHWKLFWFEGSQRVMTSDCRG